MLYILWFLHQTTTSCFNGWKPEGCISFDSYIKPQRLWRYPKNWPVVYPLIPTSNHNIILVAFEPRKLYILWFLHQTTTSLKLSLLMQSCISFDSYIKPQHNSGSLWTTKVVYPLIPTSNHNYSAVLAFWRLLYILWFLHQTTTYWPSLCYLLRCISFDSYIKPQLSEVQVRNVWVVYPLIPTSNHNLNDAFTIDSKLYILWFLHQTTTAPQTHVPYLRCISFDSYIKPQPNRQNIKRDGVVYPLIPTSNHNHERRESLANMLYILWFLHQTTTAYALDKLTRSLYILWFLHQTTTLPTL